MLPKTECLLITFYTTASALHMERVCKAEQVDGRLIPVPGFLSADCGLGWCAKPEHETRLKMLMDSNGIVPQGIHLCLI